MDVLSDILLKIKLSSAVYFKSNFSAPWGMDIPEGPFAQFHIITRGQCILKTNHETIQLFTGDIIVFPLGKSHWLADTKSSKRKNGMEVVQSIVNGKSLFEGDNVSTTLICGHFEFDRNMPHPLIKELPPIIHIADSEKKELPWLEHITNLLVQEAGSKRLGNDIIVSKLSEVLFIHVLRAFIETKSSDNGFLAAIRDERMGRVLESMHAMPEKDWQLAALAKIAGMSRTGFSNQFKVLVGTTPLSYLSQWRILQAKEILKESNKSVGEVAAAVGYMSEAAFIRVFKKRVDQTPLKYRQSLLAS